MNVRPFALDGCHGAVPCSVPPPFPSPPGRGPTQVLLRGGEGIRGLAHAAHATLALFLLSAICFAAEQTKPLEFPAPHSTHDIDGDLVCADFIHRTGQFRQAGSGELLDFNMPPFAFIKYQNAEADLRDIPLGTRMQFRLLPDAAGHFTQLAAALDDASLQAEHGTLSESKRADTDAQRKKWIEFTKRRGVPGWINKTDGNTLTLTLFSADPAAFKTMFMTDFVVGKDAPVCVANAELRTWNPPVDKEKASITAIENVPTDGIGCSGVRLVVTVPYMLEGFRKGRCIRIFGSGWLLKDSFYGESLMGYGYSRLQAAELMENVAKDYPQQFPFRTDYSNAHLPWYQLKPGIAPPSFAEHLVFGELLKADAAARKGQFRMERSDAVVDFTLIPEGAAKFLNAAATLADIPPGTRCRFHMFQNDKGAFTQASLVSDEFSFLAANAITYRVDALKLSDGKIHVARQIPETKNYNGDMERIPDIGRCELRVTADTRVWKGDKPVKLDALALDDVLLFNVTNEQKGIPSRCNDIWIGADTHKSVMEAQKKKNAPPIQAKKK